MYLKTLLLLNSYDTFLSRMNVHISYQSLESGEFRQANKVKVRIDRNSKRSGNGCYDGHRFYPLNRVVKPYPSCIWKYAPKRRSPNTYLHGPASLLSSKAIIYPCNGTVCRIVCPCLVCSGQLSKCDHVMEIHDYFEDHKMHHHAPHTRCIFCSQLFESFPQYSYKRTINIGGFACRKEYISLDSYCFTHVYKIDQNEKIETLKCDQCDKENE